MTHRYNFVSQNMNWTAAQSYCQTWHDAKLAIIANVADQLRLQTYLDLVDCTYRGLRLELLFFLLVVGRLAIGWLGSRVVSVLDSGAEGPGFKSQPQHCRVTVLGKLFTPIVPLFTKQQNWQQPS